MSQTIDHLIDRRSLRRKLTFWRVAAFAVLALALVGILGWSGAFSGATPSSPHIARVSIEGMITQDRPMLELLETIRENDAVKGVILSIDSPGGTTVGGEALFHEVRRLAEAKPTAASVGTLAASAGYMIASATDRIVARHSSIVGSIGVIMQYPQASQLLEKIGVKVNEVKSAPLKAEPSPFHPTPPEATAMLQRMIDDSFQWFVGLVAERRDMPRSEVLKIADGSVFTGNQGLGLKLVDDLGGEEKAQEWLEKERDVAAGLEIIEWEPKRPSDNPFGLSAMFDMLGGNRPNGLGNIDPNDLPAILPRRLFLDGLLSLWR